MLQRTSSPVLMKCVSGNLQNDPANDPDNDPANDPANDPSE